MNARLLVAITYSHSVNNTTLISLQLTVVPLYNRAKAVILTEGVGL